MAFEFKKLSDVNSIEAMKDDLNVLVEDGGEIVKLAANSMIPEDVALKSDIPESVSIDATLTQENAAADAKVTGEKIEEISSSFEDGIIRQEALPQGFPYIKKINGIIYEGSITAEEVPFYELPETASSKLIVGEKYTVVYDGNTYELEAKEHAWGVYIGNVSIIEEGYDGNNPPFFFTSGVIFMAETGTHTVHIEGMTVDIQKINDMYITKEIQYFTDDEDGLPDNVYDNPLMVKYRSDDSSIGLSDREVIYNAKFNGLYLAIQPAKAAVNPLVRIEINSDEITQETFSITGLTKKTQYVMNVYDSATQRMYAADFGYIPSGGWTIPGTSTVAYWKIEKVFYINGKRLCFVVDNLFDISPENTYTLTVTNLDASPS